jgi:hypothetical protein
MAGVMPGLTSGSATGAVRMDSNPAFEVQPPESPGSYRSTGDAAPLVTVPLPWLAAEGSGKHNSADNWLSSLVRSLEQLQQESPSESTPPQRPDSTGADYKQQAAAAAAVSGSPTTATAALQAGAFQAWDPSMACIETAGLVAVGVCPHGSTRSSKRPMGEQPISLQGWVEGDGNLLQHLQKRAIRTSRSYSGSRLSPLGSGCHADKLQQMYDCPSTSCALNPDANINSCTLPVFQPGAGSASAGHPGSAPAAGSAALPPSINTPAGGTSSSKHSPLLSLQDAGISWGSPSSVPAPSGAAPTYAWQGAQMQEMKPLVGAATDFVPCVFMPTAAGSTGTSSCCDQARQDDDLPLADLVKQCLSGNSFMYSSHNGPAIARPSLVSVTRHSSGIQSSSSNSRSPQNNNRSGESNSRSPLGNSQEDASEGAATQEQDNGQLADQATDKMLAEQQEAMGRFNKLRASLGITPRCTGD